MNEIKIAVTAPDAFDARVQMQKIITEISNNVSKYNAIMAEIDTHHRTLRGGQHGFGASAAASLANAAARLAQVDGRIAALAEIGNLLLGTKAVEHLLAGGEVTLTAG
ncbi:MULTISPECIES: hypothetical protein [unclassified Nocardia]|uniref:hypothetical protein n=1 Tax=unclassified Nocardia TaxID=2637762 RepID=UPI00278C1B13|nr:MULTISPECIES: hypothetical protein [unclassified Nocardia]